MSQSKIKIDAMSIMAFIILIIAALLFAGCANGKPLVLKEKEYVYMYSPFSDSLQGRGDTVINFQKVVEHDTVWQAEYYPEYKTLRIKGKPDTIKIRSPADTVYIDKTKNFPFLSKIGLLLVGLFIGCIAVFIMYYKKIRS